MTTNNLLQFKTFLRGCLGSVLITLIILVSASAQAVLPNFPDTKNAQPGKDGIYNIVEKLPSFPGGPNALMDFLNKSIKYPEGDKAKDFVGMVIVVFVVDIDGSLTDIQIIRSPNEDMSKEAIRVLQLSPKWTPASQNGQIVKARYTIPVRFNPKP